jgi:hypothetical protein
MEIIRGELSESDVPVLDVRQSEENPCVLEKTFDNVTWTQFADLSLCAPRQKIYRYTEDGFEFQSSTDDGMTWSTDEGSDPRNTSPRLPPRTGSNRQCLAAANVIAHEKATLNEVLTGIGDGLAISDLISAVSPFLLVSGILTPFVILFDLCNAAINVGVTVISDAMTDDVYADWTCLLFCRMDENGQLSPENWRGLINDCDAHFSGVASAVVNFFNNLSGAVGMSNIGRLTSVTVADCTDCCGTEECGEFDFTMSPYDFAPVSWSDGDHGYDGLGVWEDGAGMAQEFASGTTYEIGMRGHCHGFAYNRLASHYNFGNNSIMSVQVRDSATDEILLTRYIANTLEGERTDVHGFSEVTAGEVDIYIGARTADPDYTGHIIDILFYLEA